MAVRKHVRERQLCRACLDLTYHTYDGQCWKCHVREQSKYRRGLGSSLDKILSHNNLTGEQQ